MSEHGAIQEVNIALGDDISKMLYGASKTTHANRPGLLSEFHESFSGARAIPMEQFPDFQNLLMNMGFDGVGTKIEIAERTKDHSTVAHDLFAMVCDDAVVRGAETVAIGTILDVRQLDDSAETLEAVKQLAKGYIEAAEKAGVVVVNGEVAELGDRVGGYGSFNYNWGATALWIAHKDRLLTGKDIKPGDSLVGLYEPGFRSNGITDVRIAMTERYGPEWHDNVNLALSDTALGKVVQQPSTIYSRLVSSLTGGYDITREPLAKVHGVAHITGGGQPSKLGRMLEPSGYGLVIDDPFDPPEIMKHVQEIRGFSDEKAYGKWHMGPGMVIATPEPEKVISISEGFDIKAKRIGEVTLGSYIFIKSRGAQADERTTHYLRVPLHGQIH
jgi:phosphoribosylformylglycinamidine cyclo-ligase